MVKVIKAGLFSTVQDFGRVGFQQFGVPYSGVMDSYAASIANVVLGNDKHAAVIEMAMIGATLQFNCNTNICVSGADMSPKINSKAIKLHKTIAIKTGDVLSFGKLNRGFRCYIAVSGGFKTEVGMGSKSMYKGVTERFKLHENDVLPIAETTENNKKHAAVKVNIDHFTSKTIDVFKGPEFDMLPKERQQELFSKTFTVSKENNRMAYQLKETLDNDLGPIITSSVLPGTVQLTPSGKLIVLMRDCQTTGGYPRILQLKDASINTLSQKFTGHELIFNLVIKY